MISTPTIPTLANPVLLDYVLAEINGNLASELTWLDSTFGKVQRLVKDEQGRAQYYPAVYTGAQEYLNLLPDGHIGNYCFWDIEDGQELEYIDRNYSDYTAKFGLVFWFDFRKVYGSGWMEYSIENVKADVLEALRAKSLRLSSITLTKFYEQAENIYKGYNHNEIEHQFLMRPFGGFRLEGKINFKEQCA